MPQRGDVAVVIPARDESGRIRATVTGAAGLPGVDLVVVVDDGSRDDTGAVAGQAGAVVLRHGRSRGKAAAMETGAEAVRLLDGRDGRAGPRHLLFLDADLGDTAKDAGPLTEPVRSGQADMTIAVFTSRVRLGGHGLVVGLSGAGIERATGWRPAQPLNGQRCLTRAAFEAARPLAAGFGVETGLTIDLLRQGLRVREVEVPLAHRATGTDWRAQLHRARQLTDVARALAARQPVAAALAGRRPAGRAAPGGAPRLACADHPVVAGIMKAMADRYAYLGPEGTFTEAALLAFTSGAQPDLLSCPTIQATLEAVRSGAAQRAVVPIENSVEGAVTATLDELATGPELAIGAEVLLPVAFALLARPDTGLADVKTVGGHPQAQPQCRRWLAAHLPDAEWRPVSSNAEAARQAADGALDAALAGAFAAERYGLTVLARDVSDVPDAVTRFVVVGPPGPVPARTGADRTSLVAFLRADRPGALMEILTEFAVRGISLTRIESRPTGDGLGRYCFSIDCEGHLDDARVGEALMGLRRVCADVRFLGSYPREDGGRPGVRPGTSDTEFAEAAAWLNRLRYGRV